MAKLAIFDTVILWESFIVGNSEQLSHSITVPNLNSLVNIWMGLLSTNNRNREIVNRIRIADPIGPNLHISHQKSKNYMRSVIPKTRAFICDQSQLRSSFRSKVISERR